MRRITLLFLILTSSFTWKGQTTIKGVLHSKGEHEGWPGATIYVSDEKQTTNSNIDGYFQFNVSKHKRSISIFIEFPGIPIIHLFNIELKGQDILNLGSIDIITNRMVSVNDLAILKNKPLEEIAPLYHNGTLIGYTIIDEVENGDLLSNCQDKEETKYSYQYNPEKNIISIDYKVIKECR